MSWSEELDRFVTDRVAALGIPGAAVGVVLNDATHLVARGVANTDTGHPVTERTLFQIASATKPFTATAVLRLHEQGLIDLDRRVADYLPDLRLADDEARRVLTTRHLLTHTGGFVGDDVVAKTWDDNALDTSLAALVELPQIFPPGHVMSYSNAGFRLLGTLAQRVSGVSYEELVRSTVLAAVGMPNTYFFPWDAVGHDVALGHGMSGGRMRPWRYDLWRPELPEGGLLAPITDMMAWARYQLFGSTAGGPVISDEMRCRMQEPAVPAGPPMFAIGMPWQVSERGGIRLASHGGNLGNVTVTTFDLAPNRGLAVCVLANARAGKNLGAEALDWCLRNLLGMPAPEPPAVVPLSDAQLAGYLGRYDLGLGSFVVQRTGGGLRVVIEPNPEHADSHDEFPPVDVVPVGEDLFGLASDPAKLTCSFVRSADGDPYVLHMMGRAALRS